MTSTTDPTLRSWVPVPEGSDFPIQNLPYGIFRTADRSPRAGVAIGAHVLDLLTLSQHGFFNALDVPTATVFDRPALNDFIAMGRPVWTQVRERVSTLLRHDCADLRDHPAARAEALVSQADAEMLLPVAVGDYTDFYSSEEHARNVGTMFRDPDNALLPNWKHLPVGYHGRASSVVVSGTPVRRPMGQTRPQEDAPPVFGPSRLLDFEMEVAFVMGRNTVLGERIPTARAEESIFGLVLFNDWSARDIQKWEYVPLGPFLAKSFASTISPWIVTLDALAPFRVAGPPQSPPVLPYLTYEGDKNFDLNLEVWVAPPEGQASRVCQTNFRHMYWNVCQQLAHQTVNGCNVRVGDLYASGTISGPTPESYGSMLELTWRGSKPLTLADGTERKFLQDHDTVTMRGFAERDGVRVGFGDCAGQVLPARPYDETAPL